MLAWWEEMLYALSPDEKAVPTAIWCAENAPGFDSVVKTLLLSQVFRGS
jgi:hypothetical protein